MHDMTINYYLILELSLDPPVRDKVRLEAAINDKLREWHNNVPNPKKGLWCEYLATKIPEIKNALLSDDATRDSVIEEALTITKEKLASLLEAVAKSGVVTKAQLKEICKEVPEFSEETIRKMIKVPIVETIFKIPPNPADPLITPMTDDEMNQIKKNLKPLFKKNVYDFLECPRTSRPSTMCSLAKEELEKGIKAPKKTPEVSAKQALAGLIIKNFKDDNAKKAYDLALIKDERTEKLEKLFSIRCASKSIDWISYQASIADCRAIGMSQEEAEYFVYEFYCIKRKYNPPSLPRGEKSQIIVHYCKVCLSPNPEGAASCQSCGTPFKIHCPKCAQEVDFSSAYCMKCSFPIGDMPLALKLLKKSRLLIATGNVTAAEQAIRQALVYWPNNADCLSVKEEVEKLCKKAKENAEKVHLDNILIAGTVESRVSSRGSIMLKWSAASIRNSSLRTEVSKITYFVIRKAGAVPSEPNDGERLAETPQLQFEDTSCEAGIVYGYSVFPGYCGISQKIGITSPKVMTIADVSELKSVSDDGELRLQWRNPPNLTGIKCIRKLGSEPCNITDGDELRVKGGAQGLVDTGLKNNQIYGYRIFAIYKSPTGDMVVSNGVACSASPAARPKMLDTLHYEMIEQNVKLSWMPIAGYTVKLFVSEFPIASAGTFVSETDSIFAHGENVCDIDQTQGKGNWKIPSAGIFYLTPTTCKGGMALVGKSIPIIPCVTNIHVIRRAGNVEVCWDWPRGCDEVRLVWRHDNFSESAFDEKASCVTVTQAAYQRDMAYIIPHAGNESYYFSAYTTSHVDGKDVYSAPQSCVSLGESGHRSLTYFFVKRKKFLIFGNKIVTLNIKVSGKGIPELVLIKKFKRQPLGKQDGTLCCHIPAIDSSAESIRLPEGIAETGAFLKLFLANTDVEPIFHINHPSFTKMRI